MAKSSAFSSTSWLLATVGIGALAWAAYALGVATGERAAARNAQLDVQLHPWRRDLAARWHEVRATKAAAAATTASLTEHVVRMQQRTIQLDVLAVRLVGSANIGDEFDFTIDPPVGGPEELPKGGVDDSSALMVASETLGTQLDNRWRQLSVLEDVLVSRRLSADIRPEGLPVTSGYVSSRFGDRIDPITGRLAAHTGIDFAGPPGSDVVAVAAGIVIWSGPRAGYGQLIEIDHGNDRVTRYAHNAENLVTVGDVVTRGQTIARLGDTGRTTGPNLHFEVLAGGKAVNPSRYLK
jgi:murein DD-endopeptidase MepM/ murein hydrolase activator NlpD